MNLTQIFQRRTLPKVNFLGQCFQTLEHYRQTDIQTDASENITTNKCGQISIMLFDPVINRDILKVLSRMCYFVKVII